MSAPILSIYVRNTSVVRPAWESWQLRCGDHIAWHTMEMTPKAVAAMVPELGINGGINRTDVRFLVA